MRGLTNAERAELLRAELPEQSDEVTAYALQARGLVGPWVCHGCGEPESCCTPGCRSRWLVAHLTAQGALALRIDAAARALTGVA